MEEWFEYFKVRKIESFVKVSEIDIVLTSDKAQPGIFD